MARRGLQVLGVVCLGALMFFVLWRWSHRVSNPTTLSDSEEGDPTRTTSAVSPERNVTLSDGAVLDLERREAVRKAIYEAWGLKATADPHASGSWSAVPRDTFTKEYVQRRIHEDYFPLAKDCYERALAKNPSLEGSLVLSFSIVGNKNIGGIIDAVEVDESSTLNNPKTIECLRESMYTVTFDPPPSDGVVTVKVPIQFAPDDAAR